MIWSFALLLDAVTTVIVAHTMPIDSVPLIGAVKLAALIVLADVSSQVYFRREGVPHLRAASADEATEGAGR